MKDIILGISMLYGALCFFSVVPAIILILVLIKEDKKLEKKEVITVACIIFVITIVGSIFLPYYFASKETYRLADSAYGGVGFIFILTGGILAFVCNLFVLSYVLIRKKSPLQIITVLVSTNVLVYFPHLFMGTSIYMHVISKLPIKG